VIQQKFLVPSGDICMYAMFGVEDAINNSIEKLDKND